MAGPILITGPTRRGANQLVSIELNERDYRRLMERFAKYEGRPFQQRMKARYRTGVAMASKPIKAATPKRTGTLAKSVSVRTPRPPAGHFVKATVKPRKPHSHLVVLGTKPHSLATKREGKSQWVSWTTGSGKRKAVPSALAFHGGAQPHPFIDYIARFYDPKIIRFIEAGIVDEGVSVSSFASGMGGF